MRRLRNLSGGAVILCEAPAETIRIAAITRFLGCRRDSLRPQSFYRVHAYGGAFRLTIRREADTQRGQQDQGKPLTMLGGAQSASRTFELYCSIRLSALVKQMLRLDAVFSVSYNSQREARQ